MDSIKTAITELERTYDKAASLFARLPDGHLVAEKRPVILIQTAGRKQALGWHWQKGWQNGAGPLDEITICAEYLKRPTATIVETLIHEMVHHYNGLIGVKDCNASQYHNKRFASVCEAVGLAVEKGKRGFAYTSLTDPLADKVKTWKVKEEAFSLARTVAKKGQKAPTKLKKWSCPCGVNVRVAVADFEASCNKCGGEFELQD